MLKMKMKDYFINILHKNGKILMKNFNREERKIRNNKLEKKVIHFFLIFF